MNKIIIIGAGACGVYSALLIKQAHPNVDVLVLEAHKTPLKKLLATGNGRCNLSNKDLAIAHYDSDNLALVKDIIDDFDMVADKYIQMYEKVAKSEDHSTEIKKLKLELEQINRKKDKLLEYNLAGHSKDREYLSRNAMLNEDAEMIENRVAELEKRQMDTELQLDEIHCLKRGLKNCQGILPEEITQGIVNLLVDKI